MATEFSRILDQLVVADSEIAHKAEVDIKTIKSLRNGGRKPHAATIRAVLDATNALLIDRKMKSRGREIFD
jgi:hypothetical protein